ncbi:hypothetical protein [Streptomyces sp. NPDC002640]
MSVGRRVGMRAARRRGELRAEAARLQERESRLEEERRDVGRVRSRVEAWALTVAAVVGAASLGFTAWSTHMSVQVGKDQLQQSTEEDEDEERSQASLVNYWVEESRPEEPGQASEWGNRLVIVNRSPDPVSSVGIYYSVRERGGNGWTGEPGSHVAQDVVNVGEDWIPLLPPCSRAVVRAKDVLAYDGTPLSAESRIDAHELIFTDSRGQDWYRDHRYRLLAFERPGKYSVFAFPETGGTQALLLGKARTWLRSTYGTVPADQPAITDAAASVEPLGECGEAAGS